MTLAKRILSLLWLLSLAVACQAGAPSVAPTSPPTSSPTITPVPTSTPTPRPTIPPAPTSAPTIFDPDLLSLGRGERFQVLDNPRFVPAAQATWLNPDEIIIGVNHKGENRAYPLRQIAYHHIVNDTIAGDPYLVTY